MNADIRETVYEHSAGRETFTVTTMEQRQIGMIRRLAEAHPEDVHIISDENGCLMAHLPYKWMQIRAPRKVELTEERKEELAERLRRMRENQAKPNENQSGIV